MTLELKYGKDLDKLKVELEKAESEILEINRGSPFATVSADDVKNSRTSVKIFVKSHDPQYVKETIKYSKFHAEFLFL